MPPPFPPLHPCLLLLSTILLTLHLLDLKQAGALPLPHLIVSLLCISLATVPTPIHSVTIPLYTHTLRDDFPDTRDIKKLSEYLHSPTFALSIDSFLDIGFPLYALQHAYLTNSHLHLMSTNLSPSPQKTLLSHLVWEVYLEVEGSLVMAMYQLGMLEFLEDIDRYMLELSHHNSTLLLLLSPLYPPKPPPPQTSRPLPPPLRLKKSESFNGSNLGELGEMHRFPFLLPILATTKPATPVTVLAITATSVPFTNAPLVSAGNQVIIQIAALSVVTLFLILHPTPPQQRPIALPGPHATPHCPLPRLVTLIHLTPGLTALATETALLSPTKTTRTFMKTLVEMVSSIVWAGVTSRDPLMGRTMGIFESFVVVSALTRGKCYNCPFSSQSTM